MTSSSIPDLAGLDPKLQLHILTGYVLLKVAAALFVSIRDGGGLKGIACALIFGARKSATPPAPPADPA